MWVTCAAFPLVINNIGPWKGIQEIKHHLHNSYFIQLPLLGENFRSVRYLSHFFALSPLWELGSIRADIHTVYLLLYSPSALTTTKQVKGQQYNDQDDVGGKKGPYINHVLLSENRTSNSSSNSNRSICIFHPTAAVQWIIHFGTLFHSLLHQKKYSL